MDRIGVQDKTGKLELIDEADSYQFYLDGKYAFTLSPICRPVAGTIDLRKYHVTIKSVYNHRQLRLVKAN